VVSYIDRVPVTTSTPATTALTIASIKRFNRDPMTAQLRDQLTKTRKEAARLRLEVDTLLAPIFAQYTFVDIEGETIKSEDMLHCTDRDCKDWDAARHNALTAAGYDTTERQCPALVAEYEQIKAERALLDHATAMLNTGANYGSIWDANLRKQAIELFMNGSKH
jgi:hypothetical protein